MLRTDPRWGCIRFVVATTAAIALSAPAAAQPTCHYTWQRIRIPNLGLAGYGLNNHGHIAGTVYSGGDSTSAYRWTPENGIEFLPFPPGITSMAAYAMNDHGQIAGTMETGLAWFGFVWSDGVGYLALTPPSPYGIVQITDINSQGEVVGSVYRRVIPGPWHWDPFIWRNGEFTFFGEMFDSHAVYFRAINELGDCVGYAHDENGDWHAFVLRGRAQLIWLPEPEGFRRTRAEAINNNGVIVGDGTNATLGRREAIAWTPWGVFTIPPNATAAAATFSAVNDSGRAIGFYFGGVLGHAFVWQFGELELLTSLVHPPFSSGVVGEAIAINDAGQITADDRLLTPVWADGDLTGDCEVTLEDLALLLRDFGLDEGSYAAGDLNRDGIVDLLDLATVLGHFGS